MFLLIPGCGEGGRDGLRVDGTSPLNPRGARRWRGHDAQLFWTAQTEAEAENGIETGAWRDTVLGWEGRRCIWGCSRTRPTDAPTASARPFALPVHWPLASIWLADERHTVAPCVAQADQAGGMISCSRAGCTGTRLQGYGSVHGVCLLAC